MENLSVKLVDKKNFCEQHHRMYSILKSLLPQYIGRLSLLEFSSFSNLYNLALFSEKDVVGGLVLADEGDSTYIEFIGHTERAVKGSAQFLIDEAIDITQKLRRPFLRLETAPTVVPKFERYGFRNHYPKDKRGMVQMTLDV